VDTEALVVPRVGTGFGEQLVEPLLALRGDPVDAAGPLRARRVVRSGLLDD
jgi:hypothetical protein